jgi:DNA-binding response OmpR family regulator
MTVLIVEDNLELGSTIEQFLSVEGYSCDISTTRFDAEDKILSKAYDFIILDIMLPDGSGMDLLKAIKTNKIASSVLIISAKNALDDKINGLEMGADDYITKPFHLTELHARLRAVRRRKHLDDENVITFNEITINTDLFEARIEGHLLPLTRKEFDMLLYMMVNKNRIISRQSLAAHLWGDYTDDLANFDFVYQHVKNLRKKIIAAGGNDYLNTVYGIGYKFAEKE